MDSIIDKAKHLIEQNKLKEALNLLQSLNGENNVESNGLLGLIYQSGIDGKRDVIQAIKYLIKAAESGSAVSAHNLGTLYLTCEPDLPIDKRKSKEWYSKAQDLGFFGSEKNWFINEDKI